MIRSQHCIRRRSARWRDGRTCDHDRFMPGIATALAPTQGAGWKLPAAPRVWRHARKKCPRRPGLRGRIIDVGLVIALVAPVLRAEKPSRRDKNPVLYETTMVKNTC